MNQPDLILLGILILVILIPLCYVLGWSFSAGYHNHKYQHTKRLVQLLREGTQ